MWARSIIKGCTTVVRSRQSLFVKSQHLNHRLLSRTVPILAVNQQDEDEDLMFDLGKPVTSTTKRQTEPKSTNRFDVNDSKRTSSKPNSNKQPSKLSKQDNEHKPKARKTFEELTVFDKTLNLPIVKLPYSHPKLHELMMKVKSKNLRAKAHHLVIEGRRLILEALEAGLPLDFLLFSRIDQVEQIKDTLKFEKGKPVIIRVPHHDLTLWSVLSTCPGLIGIFIKPTDMSPIWESRAIERANQPQITVICDQVREPNNLGGIVRTCAAVGCTQVILVKGCADPWETKALRGGCGAQFRIPVRGPMQWESITSFLPENNEFSVYVADNSEQASRTQSITGNTQAKLDPIKSYADINFKQSKHVVLIVGGETEGVSKDAIDFMESTQQLSTPSEDNATVTRIIPNNERIQIPMFNGMESLNSNAAAAVLLYEIRKQLLTK